MSSGIRRFSSFSYCFLSINSIGLYLKYFYGKLAKCLLYKYSVRRRAYVLFTLFVFVCVQWRPTRTALFLMTSMTWQYSVVTQKLHAHRLCLWPFMLKLSYVTSFTSITWNPLYFNVRIKWEKEEKSHCRKNSTTPLLNRLQRQHWHY
jgi:hypothetical protein